VSVSPLARTARLFFRLLLLGFPLAFSALAQGCRAAPQRAESAAGAQAAGRRTDAPPPEATSGFDGGKAYAHVERLVGIGPRPPGTDGIHRAQDYLRTQLRDFGCPVEEDDFHASTPIGSVAMKNILVKIPGGSPNVILLATHYDTKRLENFVGANDGGSSTGLMLELARLLCGRKHAVSIWIAFLDGEEAFGEWSSTDGTYGSRQMAAKLAGAGELKRVKALLLADLIGDRNLKIKREANSTRWLTDLVWSTAARLGYQNIFVSEQIAIEDDHLPFLRRNVAAADIIDLDEPYWHTPGDTLDKVSARSLAVVGHVFLESVAELEKKLR
jgi:hypothetical protein